MTSRTRHELQHVRCQGDARGLRAVAPAPLAIMGGVILAALWVAAMLTADLLAGQGDAVRVIPPHSHARVGANGWHVRATKHGYRAEPTCRGRSRLITSTSLQGALSPYHGPSANPHSRGEPRFLYGRQSRGKRATQTRIGWQMTATWRLLEGDGVEAMAGMPEARGCGGV